MRDLERFDRDELLLKCQEYFEITKSVSEEDAKKALDDAYKAQKIGFVLYSEYGFDVLISKVDAVPESMENGSEALRGLDVSILHTLILERLMGIDKENMAKQINLTYTRSDEEAISEVNSKKAQCAFLLNPTRVEEIKNVALAGEKMPQKSTYFYPKLITGLTMNKLD